MGFAFLGNLFIWAALITYTKTLSTLLDLIGNMHILGPIGPNKCIFFVPNNG